MAELAYLLAVVLCINGLLWLSQVAVTAINPSGPVFFNCQGSMISQFEQNGCVGGTANYVVADATPANGLPTSGSTVQVDSGNFFTDTFAASVNWFTQATGLQYLYNILAAPSNFLKAIGLPSEMSFAIGAMWYGFSLLVLIAFLLGRNS